MTQKQKAQAYDRIVRFVSKCESEEFYFNEVARIINNTNFRFSELSRKARIKAMNDYKADLINPEEYTNNDIFSFCQDHEHENYYDKKGNLV